MEEAPQQKQEQILVANLAYLHRKVAKRRVLTSNIVIVPRQQSQKIWQF